MNLAVSFQNIMNSETILSLTVDTTSHCLLLVHYLGSEEAALGWLQLSKTNRADVTGSEIAIPAEK